jgi:hypothetical protein
LLPLVYDELRKVSPSVFTRVTAPWLAPDSCTTGVAPQNPIFWLAASLAVRKQRRDAGWSVWLRQRRII